VAKRRKEGQAPTPEPTIDEMLTASIYSRTQAVQKFIFMHPAGTRAMWQPGDVIKWWMNHGVVENYTDAWINAAFEAEQRGER